MNIAEYERKVYSQFSEDGITLEIVRRLNPPHCFLEIGCGNGSENNTRILAEQGWTGLWIDADALNCARACAIGSALGVQVLCEQVGLPNIASVKLRVPQYLGLLSIDVDGNDYHLWKALCSGTWGLKPACVIIECQIQKDRDQPFVMPYEEGHVWDNASCEVGASVYSMMTLGSELGYSYLGIPSSSVNAFFVRTDLLHRLDPR